MHRMSIQYTLNSKELASLLMSKELLQLWKSLCYLPISWDAKYLTSSVG